MRDVSWATTCLTKVGYTYDEAIEIRKHITKQLPSSLEDKMNFCLRGGTASDWVEISRIFVGCQDYNWLDDADKVEVEIGV